MAAEFKNDRPKTGGITVLGFALFAMFFGAGNLIFPPALGRMAGNEYWLAALGFICTGVGLPLMGIFAVARAGGGIDKIAAPLGKTTTFIVSVAIMLSLGPLFAIPRTAATTFELAIAPNITFMNSWIFSAIYFAIVLYFALNPTTAIDYIGKILTPLLFASLLALIVKGVLYPLSAPIGPSQEDPFGFSFLEGYQTMDMIAATIFGIALLNEIVSKGARERGQQISTIIKAGIISATGLGLIYGGLVYLGATSTAIEGNPIHTELLFQIAKRLLGEPGDIVLGIAVSMACITTAIGLIVACSQYFTKLLKEKVGYKTICISIAAVGYVLSNAGVEEIIKIAMPCLMALYPPVIVMVILTLMGEKFGKLLIWAPACTGALLMSIGPAMSFAGLHIKFTDVICNFMPLSKHGLSWIAPSVTLGTIGAAFDVIVKKSKRRPHTPD